ncbi:hypothetical protein EJB05_37329, partial [Eragrostis curvula]
MGKHISVGLSFYCDLLGMDAKKPYIMVIIIQLIFTGQYVVNKAAFNHGLNTFVFLFYRQAAASLLLLPTAVFVERRNARSMSLALLLKLFVYALIGNTISLNLFNVSLKMTSATVASATTNSMPVITFCLALLFRMEEVKLRSPSGVAKLTGVALCLAGVFVIAFYAGPSLSPVNHHRAFGTATRSSAAATTMVSQSVWIKGTLMAVLAIVTWSLWIVLQAAVLKEYPNKILVTVTQCVLSAVQCFAVAAVAEKNFSLWKLRLDVGSLAIAYSQVPFISVYGGNMCPITYMWSTEDEQHLQHVYDPQMATGVTQSPVYRVINDVPLVTDGAAVHLLWFSSLTNDLFSEVKTINMCIIGGILLAGGLYSVLWGQSKETNMETCNIEVNVANTVQNEPERSKPEEMTKCRKMRKCVSKNVA